MLSLALSLLAAPALQEPTVTQSATPVRLPELGLTVTDVRRVLADGGVERVGLAPDGSVVDVDALLRADRALEQERHGRVDATLRDRLAGAPAHAPIEVAYWLVEPADGFDGGRLVRAASAGLPSGLRADAVRAARADALRQNEERLRAGVEAFAAAVVDAGGEPIVRGLGWPLVIARVPAQRVAELAAHPLVDTAYVSQTQWAPEGGHAQGTMRTPLVHAQGVFVDGDVRVMINDVGGVWTANPYLPPVIELVPGSADFHATGVAGNVANTHPEHHAAAYTLPAIYSAPGSSDASAPSVWATGIAAGIDLGNCSWWNFLKGKIEFLDRFFDYTIRHYSVMMFKSAGNQGTTGSPYVTSPGNGYNMIASGSYSDADDSVWSNDFMAASSSYLDPIEGHAKPEVVAPGECVTTTAAFVDLQGCFTGTSSASPLVCGVAALLLAEDDELFAQMTTLKAALMVSAWHNVEGAALLSDRDGAGAVHAKAAHALVRDRQWWFQDVTAASFPGDVLDVPIALSKGDETRVIALWQSDAAASYATDVLAMDVDLVVLAPGGAPVAASASAADPFELATFVPPTSGTYTVRLTKQRFDGVSEPLTVAWSTRNDAGTARIELAPAGPPFSIGQSPVLRLRDVYVPAGSDYAAWPSLSGLSATSLGGGFAAPIGFDPLSQLALSLPGWIGSLNPSGGALATLPIPDLPALVGLEVHFGMVVWPAGSIGAPLGAPISVSDPLKLAIGT